ncbi:hypothetical protein MKX03_032551 [Papaver bracteatum]|nr:hypothetical protein MKX03_032551 [Papaver bracteatum]
MDSSNFTHFKPEIEKDEVLGFIPLQISGHQCRAMCVIDEKIFDGGVFRWGHGGQTTYFIFGYGCARKETQEEISCKDSAKEEMMNSERSNNICTESKQDEVFQLKDVVTGDQHLILVVETTQELSASGSNNDRMSAEIGSTRIVSGYGCARKETMSSIYLGKKRAGIFSENIRQPRRRFTETNSKKDVLSMFVEARNIFCQKKLDGNKG